MKNILKLTTKAKEELEYFNSFISSQINHGVNINYGKVIFKNQNQNNKMEKLASLLEYAPSNFLDKVIKKLEEYQNISDDY